MRRQPFVLIGGERGTRTLDLGIMSAIWPFFPDTSFHNPLISLDGGVQHFPLFSLVAAEKPAH
jgi:hypothetical protein